MQRIRISSLVQYILIMFFFYFGQISVLNYTILAQYSKITTLTNFGMTLIVFGFFFVKERKNVSYVAMLIGGLCIVNYVLSMVINQDWRGSYAFLIINVVTAILFTCIFERQQFYSIYINCMVIVCVCGLVATYVIVPFWGGFFGTFANPNGASQYYNLILSYPLDHVEAYRLNAIWTEPGILAAYLMFAIIFQLFFIKSDHWKTLILIVSMLATRSSTGYVILVLVLGTYILEKVIEKKNIIILVWSMMIACACFMGMNIVAPKIMSQILSKYEFNDISFIGRFAPMIYNMDIWRTSPLLGVGFHEGAFRVNYSIYRGVLFANTSTTTLLFHNFGIMIPILSIIATWKISTIITTNRLISLLLTFTMVLGVNFENQVLDPLYIIMLFSVFMRIPDTYRSC